MVQFVKAFFQTEVMTRDKEEPLLGLDVTGVSAGDKCKDDISAVEVLHYMKIYTKKHKNVLGDRHSAFKGVEGIQRLEE